MLLLCTHFLRNLAFFRAGKYRAARKKTNQYWIGVTNNCLDHSVLEWCKLFADPKGKHHWRKLVDDEATFNGTLLTSVRMTQAEFDAYIKSMREYRDKFLAHLDEDAVMKIPALRPAQRAIHTLYSYILRNESGYFPVPPGGAASFYSTCFRLARREVR